LRTIYDPNLVRKDPARKYLFKQFKAKAELVFVSYKEEIRGIVEKIRRYEFKLQGWSTLVDKINVLYFFKTDAIKSVKQNVEVDKDVVEENLKPAKEQNDRLDIPDDILQKCFNEKTVITITMRNGHVLKGHIHSYGIFSIRLQLNKKHRVILFRHAIYDLEYRQKDKPSK
jgi:sRNA-binding regulator protein Hfq